MKKKMIIAVVSTALLLGIGGFLLVQFDPAGDDLTKAELRLEGVESVINTYKDYLAEQKSSGQETFKVDLALLGIHSDGEILAELSTLGEDFEFKDYDYSKDSDMSAILFTVKVDGRIVTVNRNGEIKR